MAFNCGTDAVSYHLRDFSKWCQNHRPPATYTCLHTYLHIYLCTMHEGRSQHFREVAQKVVKT